MVPADTYLTSYMGPRAMCIPNLTASIGLFHRDDAPIFLSRARKQRAEDPFPPELHIGKVYTVPSQRQTR